MKLLPADFNLPNDLSRPVMFALGRASFEKWTAIAETTDALKQLAIHPEREGAEADAKKLMKTVIQLLETVNELGRWIYCVRALPIEEAFTKAQTFKELGNDWTERLCALLQKLPQGSPPTRRQVHINAFEFMLQSRTNSLGKATKKYCPCGKKHTEKCYEGFKTGIRSLKKILRKFAPDLVTQYDALHPDRAKPVNHRNFEHATTLNASHLMDQTRGNPSGLTRFGPHPEHVKDACHELPFRERAQAHVIRGNRVDDCKPRSFHSNLIRFTVHPPPVKQVQPRDKRSLESELRLLVKAPNGPNGRDYLLVVKLWFSKKRLF